jgi:hypothetical protein
MPFLRLGIETKVVGSDVLARMILPGKPLALPKAMDPERGRSMLFHALLFLTFFDYRQPTKFFIIWPD